MRTVWVSRFVVSDVNWNMTVAGVTSTVGCLIAATNSQARLLFNSGREGLFPKWLGKVSAKHGTPVRALMTFMGIGLVGCFGWAVIQGIPPLTLFAEPSTLGTILVILLVVWLLGGSTQAGWGPVLTMLPYLAIGIVILLLSGHALNLLQELEGSLPAERARLLALLDEFLSLSPRERAEFALGARLGVYRRLADRHDPRLRVVLEGQTEGLLEASDDEVLAAAARLRSRFI